MTDIVLMEHGDHAAGDLIDKLDEGMTLLGLRERFARPGMRVARQEAVAAEEGFLVKNSERDGTKAGSPADAPDRVYYLARHAFDADLVIYLPKLKTHAAATYTAPSRTSSAASRGSRMPITAAPASSPPSNGRHAQAGQPDYNANRALSHAPGERGRPPRRRG